MTPESIFLETRYGEYGLDFFRSERIHNEEGRWYLSTREGRRMGPFRDRSTAEKATSNLTEFMQLAPEGLQRHLSSSLRT